MPTVWYLSVSENACISYIHNYSDKLPDFAYPNFQTYPYDPLWWTST